MATPAAGEEEWWGEWESSAAVLVAQSASPQGQEEPKEGSGTTPGNNNPFDELPQEEEEGEEEFFDEGAFEGFDSFGVPPEPQESPHTTASQDRGSTVGVEDSESTVSSSFMTDRKESQEVDVEPLVQLCVRGSVLQKYILSSGFSKSHDRFFRISDDRVHLMWGSKPSNASRKFDVKQIRAVEVPFDAPIQIATSFHFSFITFDNKLYRLSAESASLRDQWVKCLRYLSLGIVEDESAIIPRTTSLYHAEDSKLRRRTSAGSGGSSISISRKAAKAKKGSIPLSRGLSFIKKGNAEGTEEDGGSGSSPSQSEDFTPFDAEFDDGETVCHSEAGNEEEVEEGSPDKLRVDNLNASFDGPVGAAASPGSLTSVSTPKTLQKPAVQVSPSTPQGLPPRPSRHSATSSVSSDAEVASLSAKVREQEATIAELLLRIESLGQQSTSATPPSSTSATSAVTPEILNKMRNTLQQQRSEIDDLKRQLQVQNSQAQSGAQGKSESDIESLQRELNTAQQTIATLSGKLQEAEAQIQRLTAQLSESAAEQSLQAEKRLEEAVQAALAKGEQEGREKMKTELEGEVAKSSGEISKLEAEAAELRRQLQDLENQLLEKDRLVQEAKESEKKAVEEAFQMNELVRKGELQRRALHNKIMDLRGSIRVFCRVRPLLEEEEESALILYPREQDNTIDIASARTSDDLLRFTFDRIFDEKASQAEIFEEISQLVQSALDGYNVCVFAYGVTGSGKTFTMEGPSGGADGIRAIEGSDARGIIPRVVEQIFESYEAFQEEGWDYTFEASFLEIYNDQIRDLLAEPGKDVPHQIIHERDGRTYASDLITEPVQDVHEVYELLGRASRQRTWAATTCNAFSSRSHSIFQLKLTGTHRKSGQRTAGLLNLVDLAGSERLKKTENVGERLKETQFINKSLTCLGDVIAALVNKQSHIPFRNSKLTDLLSTSLGNNSKTLMFINISPTMTQLPESICSLRFATKVNNANIQSKNAGGGHGQSIRRSASGEGSSSGLPIPSK